MDKYQSYILKELQIIQSTANENDLAKISLCDKGVKIQQSRNSDIVIFPVTLSVKGIEKIEVFLTDWQELFKNEEGFSWKIDFNNKVSKMRISFINDIADSLTLDCEYVESDKEFWKRISLQRLSEERLTKAQIKVSTGADLVNIYFQPCCDEYVRAEITLYKDNMMLAKYKVDEETFFKSINGLAFGKYEFVLKQLDKDSNMLLETNKISFSINKPDYGSYGGKHQVINRF